MSEDHPRYWFPAKTYGWGWGLPSTWEGWLVLVGYPVGREPLIATVRRTAAFPRLCLGLPPQSSPCENDSMTTRVKQIAEQVKSLPLSEREELLAWLADFELGQVDAWDEEIARDSQPGGRMQRVLDRVRRDIVEGRTKPLGEVIDNE
jgi:hypothetical protein